MITRETWPSLKLHERRINELDHPAVQIEEKRAIFRKNVAAMLRQELLIYGGPMQTQDVTDMNTPLRTFWMAQGLQGADTAVYAITLPGDDAPFKMLFIVDIETKDWMAKDDFHTHLLLTVQQGYWDLVVEKAKQKGVPISRKCLSQFVLSDGYFNFFWYDTEERLLRAFDPKERGITLSRGAAGHMEVDIETDGTIQALPRIETVAHEDGVLRLKAG